MRNALLPCGITIRLLPALILSLVCTQPAAAQTRTATPPPDDAPGETARSPVAGPAGVAVRPLRQAPPAALAPMIGGGVWLAEGPGPAIGGQVESIMPGPGEVVGAIHVIAAHPTDPDVLFAGGTNGGIWRTDNALAPSPFWTPLTDDKPSLSMGALEFDPTDPTHETLVAGIGRYSSFSSSGGVRTGKLLKTTDGGATWTELGGFIGSPSAAGISGVAPRGSIIVASANVSDAFFCSDVGLWRSTDGGASFTKLSFPDGVPEGIAFDLASDAASPSTLYTGFTFAGPCTAAPAINAIFKSVDTGATWSKVSDPAMEALLVDVDTNNIEIAAFGLDVYVNIVQFGRPVGIFHSADGGATWTAMDLPRTPEGAPLPIGGVAPSPFCAGPPVMIDTTPTPHGFPGLAEEVELMGVLDGGGLPHPINGVWTTLVTSPFTFDLVGSCDTTPWMPGSGTWVKVVGLSPKEKAGSQGGIHAAIRVDPGIASTVYLGGDRQDSPFPNFLGAGDFSGRLFRGDVTVAPTGAIPSPQWEHLTHMIGPPTAGGGTLSSSAPHADSREIVFDAEGNLIEGDDGGIYRRTSPASSAGDWYSINGNIQVNEQHDVAYDALSDIIISGNQDTGTTQQMTPHGLTWDSVSTADGGDVAVDDISDPAKSTRYSSFQNLGALRRREYDASNMMVSETFPTLLGGAPSKQFVTPVVLHATMPSRLLIGACDAIYESFDKGDTITAIPGPGFGCPQNAIAYGNTSIVGTDIIWVGASASVFQRLGPPGMPLVVTPTPFPGGLVRDIVLDPADPLTAYVVDDTDVYMTHDGGTTWTFITGVLVETQLRSAVIDPAGRLFAGGRDGVYVLPLPAPGIPPVGPFMWGEIGTGLPNAPVWDMEWDVADTKLVVGTLGRGAWSFQENGTCGFPKNLVVNNRMVAAASTFKACNEIVGGPALTVDATADVDFVAGIEVGFGNGTVLGGTATVSVEIDAALISP